MTTMLWELLLIISVAGVFVILVRKIPAVREKVRSLEHDSVEPRRITHRPKTTDQPRPRPPEGEEKSARTIGLTKAPARVESVPTRTLEKADLPKGAMVSDVILPDVVSVEAADTAFKSHRFEEAKQMYQILLREEGDHPKYYNRLGILALELGDLHEARDAFRRALKFGEHIASRHANLAMAEYALGHRLTAVQHLKKALALAPNTKKYEDMLEEIESGKER